MITQCSYCSTKFEISKELVESQDPRVRCGECLNVFNAKKQLVIEEEFSEPSVPTVTRKVQTAAQTESRTTAAALESYISADDLENAATIVMDENQSAGGTRSASDRINDGFYSPDLDYQKSTPKTDSLLDSTTLEFEQTMLLEPDALDQSTDDLDAAALAPRDTGDLPEVALQQPAVGDEMLDRESLARDTATEQSGSSAAELRNHVNKRGGEVVPLADEAELRSAQQSSMLVPLLCCAVALLSVLYFARDQIAQLDLPEPVLTTFCSVTGCELPVAKDLDRLELLRHKLSSHADLSDVLVINVDIVNRAPFDQPYPVLAITMSNADGEPVATRKFQPADYLEPDALGQTLPTDELVRISFEILDPGPEATSSGLSFE